MWWYQSLHRLVAHAIARFAPGKSGPVLDAGCGTGGFIRFCQSHSPAISLYGIDASAQACQLAYDRNCHRVSRASVNELPFRAASFGVVVSADVLYHQQVDPEKAMREFHRCLRPGGTVVIQLPAYEWLRSYHDVQVQTRHRYTRPEVRDLLAQNGFEVRWLTHWNSLAFPLLLLRRFVFPPRPGQSDVQNYAGPVQFLLSTLMHAEEAYLKWGGRFGWGSSILAVGSKKS